MATNNRENNGADITPNDSVNADCDISVNDTAVNGTDTGKADNKIDYSAIVNGDLDIDTDSLSGREKSNVTGCKNLVPFSDLTEEEHKTLCSKAGKASGETRRKQRDMREVAKAILYHAMDEKQIQEVLGTSESLLDGDKSVMAVLTARMVQEAGKGSYKHYETLRDTAGFKPKDEVGITADIITDADRALMDKVAKRLNVKDA